MSSREVVPRSRSVVSRSDASQSARSRNPKSHAQPMPLWEVCKTQAAVWGKEAVAAMTANTVCCRPLATPGSLSDSVIKFKVAIVGFAFAKYHID